MSPELARVFVLFATSLFAALVILAALREDAGVPRAARRRARGLFLAKLDRTQRLSWLVRRRFEVRGSCGRRYTIAAYRPFNISTADAVFCVQVNGRIPVYDKLLAQKLLIEADETLFLAHANMRTHSRSWESLVAAARSRHPTLSALT
jgi:hypothetical protein